MLFPTCKLVFIWCLFGVYFGVLVFILGEMPCKVKVLQTLMPWAFTAFCESSQTYTNYSYEPKGRGFESLPACHEKP